MCNLGADMRFLARSVILREAPLEIYPDKFSFDVPSSPWRVLPFQHTRPGSGITRPSIVTKILLGISHRLAGYNTPAPLSSAPFFSPSAVRLSSIDSQATRDAVRGVAISQDVGVLLAKAAKEWAGRQLPSESAQDPAEQQRMLDTVGDLGLPWSRCKGAIKRERRV